MTIGIWPAPAAVHTSRTDPRAERGVKPADDPPEFASTSRRNRLHHGTKESTGFVITAVVVLIAIGLIDMFVAQAS